jgi:hypothetical protein
VRDGPQREVAVICFQTIAKRASHGEPGHAARDEREQIADAGKGDETVEAVIAIRPATEDTQAQIDLRRCAARQH